MKNNSKEKSYQQDHDKKTNTQVPNITRLASQDPPSSTDLRGEQWQLHQTKEMSHVLGALLKVVLQPYHKGLQGGTLVNDQDGNKRKRGCTHPMSSFKINIDNILNSVHKYINKIFFITYRICKCVSIIPTAAKRI